MPVFALIECYSGVPDTLECARAHAGAAADAIASLPDSQARRPHVFSYWLRQLFPAMSRLAAQDVHLA